ncbi:MAG: hypothetical protein ACRENL_07110 [Candidatus Dormibacteria bacterium]
MTPSGLTDRRAPSVGSSPGTDEESLGGASDRPAASPGGADVDTRHRLRRALRILLAARRRDDGGGGHIHS